MKQFPGPPSTLYFNMGFSMHPVTPPSVHIVCSLICFCTVRFMNIISYVVLLQEDRIILMGHFLDTASTLMSNQLRELVLNSIADFIATLSTYTAGNDYKPPYKPVLPTVPPLIVIFMVGSLSIIARVAIQLDCFKTEVEKSFF